MPPSPHQSFPSGGCRFKPIGDIRLIEVVLVNLLDNAIKFAARNSRIEYCIHSRSHSYAFSLSSIVNNEVYIAREQIFSPYRRREEKKLKTSTGLGLPVSHKILNAHSSEAEFIFSSAPVGGNHELVKTTLEFVLPYDPKSRSLA